MSLTTEQSLERIIRQAATEIVASAAAVIAQAVAAIAAEELERSLLAGPDPGPARRAAKASRARPRVVVTRWVADRRARRVPNFVIEVTGGLDTKKAIVARFGENAVFEKGKGLPKPAKVA
ncbi:MAG TPA: hypothetical protein VFE30_02580 [Anaeromyxobacteraceae bacterium]|jgi:hypothetical protein|nr:hypothetical protein [Anaeromyxobacteraceae bacterium]